MLSQVLCMCDQSFHLIKYWVSVSTGSVIVTVAPAASPPTSSSSSLYTAVLLPVSITHRHHYITVTTTFSQYAAVLLPVSITHRHHYITVTTTFSQYNNNSMCFNLASLSFVFTKTVTVKHISPQITAITKLKVSNKCFETDTIINPPSNWIIRHHYTVGSGQLRADHVHCRQRSATG